jgi:beta-glucosidase
MFVGYRHYDTKDVAPRFCFGHGLSYTTFAYGGLTLGRDGMDVVVEVDVANTGHRRGAEVIQVYVGRSGSRMERPDKELKAFEKVWLDPGETTRLRLQLTEQALRHWDESESCWQIERGAAEILVGASSRDIRLRATTTL